MPRLADDFVLLTPLDMLTRDDTWINQGDMVRKFQQLPAAVPNAQLRAQINQYFRESSAGSPTLSAGARRQPRRSCGFPS